MSTPICDNPNKKQRLIKPIFFQKQQWRILRADADAGASATFHAGDAVFVRSESALERGCRGVFVENDNAKHAWVYLSDTNADNKMVMKKKRVKRKRLFPIFYAEKEEEEDDDNDEANGADSVLILVVAKTLLFRQLALSQVTAKDRVLEIGCSTGETSAILCRSGACSWVGLDSSESMVATTQKRLLEQQQQLQQHQQSSNHSSTTMKTKTSCHCVDALLDPAAATLFARQFQDPTTVFLDIGGSREMEGVVRMLDWILNTTNHHDDDSSKSNMSSSSSSIRLVVVKSERLFQVMHPLCHKKTGILFQESTTTTSVDVWFRQLVKEARTRTLPKHPLQAPKRTISVVVNKNGDTDASGNANGNGTDEETKNILICRYHNYHTDGCAKGSAECPYDHQHCHLCLQAGHVARKCTTLL